MGYKNTFIKSQNNISKVLIVVHVLTFLKGRISYHIRQTQNRRYRRKEQTEALVKKITMSKRRQDRKKHEKTGAMERFWK